MKSQAQTEGAVGLCALARRPARAPEVEAA
jgi:hypothetical protein